MAPKPRRARTALRTSLRLLPVAVCALLLLAAAVGAAPRGSGPEDYQRAFQRLHENRAHAAEHAVGVAATPESTNFTLLGQTELGDDTNGDVWVHGNFAYVGNWAQPCSGEGLKIIDVSDLSNPKMIGRIAARPGTWAEDIVVRRVSTHFFTGDLLATGIQRCGDDPALDDQTFGIELWDVTDPYNPNQLGVLGVTNGGGGVHELDMFQRGDNIYALLATPFHEWFDPMPARFPRTGISAC